MKSLKKAILAAAMLLSAAAIATAQNNTITPYSRFGYGVLGDRVSASQSAMGGIGYAMNHGRQINAMNPASYAAIDTLTFLFDVGVDFKYLNTSQENADKTVSKGKNTTGGLNYITMQVPIGRHMGASAGLLPYSQVGYAFGDKVVNGESAFQGNGGINEVYLGFSGNPFKGFYVGANVSYLFGTLLNDNYITTGNGSQSLFEQSISVQDYDLRFGMQYSFNIGQKNRFTLGAVYSPGKHFLGRVEAVKYDVTTATVPDTIFSQHLRHCASRPDTYGGGINYNWNNRVMVEADFTYQPWSKCEIPYVEGFDHTTFDNRWKASFGFEVTPDPRGGYFKRVNYRAGAYLNRDYVMVGENHVKDVGVTFGLGLPAPINRLTNTVINVGFEYRHRQSSPQALVKENYFQVTLGINFNELWFWQNKIQ